MSVILDDDGTYRIETKVSAGKIEDPVTGEQHTIDSYDDRRGGEIEVSRPDSAKYIVDSSSRHQFAGKAPTAEAVKEAQREEFDFAGSEICESFAAKRGDTLGQQDLGKSDGFDPVADGATNDPKLKVTQMYESLQSADYESEAAYLRALPTLSKQEAFVSYVRSHGEISL